MDKSDQPIQLQVEGMTCTNCALGITRFLEQKGLKKVHVNFATGEVYFNALETTNIEPIIKGIHALGYKVVGDNIQVANKSFTLTIKNKFIICALFTLPLLLSMIPAFSFLHAPMLQLLLCIPVFLIGLQHFGRSAISSLKAGVPNMDVLIITGSSAAFAYSTYGYIVSLGMNYMFFETAASIITLVLLGNLLEQRSILQTTTAIRELKQLQPEFAKKVFFDLLSGNEQVELIPVHQLQINDIVLVNTGDKIPADGNVYFGEAFVDESMITGESIPVRKILNAPVTGGTINTDGNFKLKVSTSSENSILASIVAMVKQANMEKPGIQKLADKISAIFVPVVILIALLTFFISFLFIDLSAQSALMNSIAVLVIACPCAMGLATPTAIMVGLGRSAKNGILVKGANTFETFAKTKIIVFDKTGTLTDGNFDLEELKIFQGKEMEIHEIIHTLESRSSHPVAISLAKLFTSHSLIDFISIEEIKGKGLKGVDSQQNSYGIGSESLFPDLLLEGFDLYVVKNNILLAGIKIKDEIKANAQEIINYFKALNIKTILLSGDHENKTRAVAESIGVDEYYSKQSPADKLLKMNELTNRGIVTMIGDGINDSPALEKAHVGISMSNATQIAINSAQIVLLNGNLKSLEEAHRLSVLTLKTIKQNLFWAFFYNVLAIPIAAIGLLSPIIAALSMAFSDVFVIGNSILLKTKKTH